MHNDPSEIETWLRTGAHEAELRTHFGDALYEELASLSRTVESTLNPFETRRRKVLILPGIMGSRLSVIEDGQPYHVWIDPVDFTTGGLSKLKWGASVVATGTVLAPYMRMLLRLKLAGYDAEFLPYDWRQSPVVGGTALMRHLMKRNLSDVTLVCHSMGGLLARQMAAEDPNRRMISRVITIGTPNFGSYAPMQVYDLSHGMVQALAAVDLTQDRADIVKGTLRGFPGLAEILPSPVMRPEQDAFNRKAWPKTSYPPQQTALSQAAKAAASLPEPDGRFQQIIGVGAMTTIAAEQDLAGFVYTQSYDGDGTVPRDLAEMGDVPRYYAEGKHGRLCNAGDVIAATVDLIESGATAALPSTPPAVAFETLSRTLTSQELRTELDTEFNTADETVFAGDLLSRGLEPVGTPRSSAAAHAAAYAPEVVRSASQRWRASDAERQNVLQSQSEARPLQAETPERLDAYARRLISQVDAASATNEARKISRQLEGALRDMVELQGPALPVAATLERVIGEAEEFLSVMFIKRAVVAARAVGRIVSRDTGRGFGTGFLIAPGVLITNHHVLETALQASRTSVQFRYELEIDSREAPGHTFALEPARLFHSDARLDLAIIAVAPVAEDGTSIGDFGYLPLIGVEGKIRKGQPVNIIQHPLAGRKQVVFRDSLLSALPTDPDFVAHYTGDTQPGSSGAPVFSDLWEVIALHHSGVPDQTENGTYLTQSGTPWNAATDPQMRTVHWVANEGIRVSRIVRHLERLPETMSTQGLAGATLIEDVLARGRRAAREGTFPLNGGQGGPLAPEHALIPPAHTSLTLPVHISIGQPSVTAPFRPRSTDSPPRT
jgi:V8-like Glu-specific endopeptidase/pimeloyl-ACP methyl ester carboxylesterase